MRAGRSRAARRVTDRSDAAVWARALALRAKLEADPCARVGAPALACELEQLAAVVGPLRTIEPIPGRAGATGLARQGRRVPGAGGHTSRRRGRGVDVVGPRQLHGGARL